MTLEVYENPRIEKRGLHASSKSEQIAKKDKDKQDGLQLRGGSSLMSILALLDLQQSLLNSLKTWGDFTATCMKNQMTLSVAAADHIKKAADASGYSMLTAGITSIVGAGITAKATMTGSKEMRDAAAEQSQVREELDPVDANMKTLDETVASGDLEMTDFSDPNRTTQTQELVEQMRGLDPDHIPRNTRGTVEFNDDHRNLLQAAKDAEANPGVADQYKDLRTKWRDRQRDLAKRENTAANKHSSAAAAHNSKVQSINAVSQALSTSAQGVGQIQKGTEDRQNQIQSTLAQQAGAIANQASQTRSQSEQVANNVNNIINKIKSSEIQA